MDIFRIEGEVKLKGTVRLSGSKNATLPIMAACILAPGTSVIKGAPELSDIAVLMKLLSKLGATVERNSAGDLQIDTAVINNPVGEYNIVRKMRASICILGPLLARCGKAKISMPGGCAIGDRPVDIHLRGLRELGDKEMQDALLDLTQSDDEFRRYSAVAALCIVGRESTIPRVVGLLDDKSERVVEQTHKTLLTVANRVYGTTPRVKPTRSSWESWLERADAEAAEMKAVYAKVKEVQILLRERRGYKRGAVLVDECEKSLNKIRVNRLVTPAKSIARLSKNLRLMRYQCFKMQPLETK